LRHNTNTGALNQDAKEVESNDTWTPFKHNNGYYSPPAERIKNRKAQKRHIIKKLIFDYRHGIAANHNKTLFL
jgi:hypothetical protein